jgi:hypothetical protein
LGHYYHLFSDNGFNGAESGINDFAGRKTGLFIPFWLADRFLDGLEDGEEEKGGVGDAGIWSKTKRSIRERWRFGIAARSFKKIFLYPHAGISILFQ